MIFNILFKSLSVYILNILHIYILYIHALLKNPFHCELHGTVHKINIQLNESSHTHTHTHTHTQKGRKKKTTTQVKKEKVACTPLFMKFIYVFTRL